MRPNNPCPACGCPVHWSAPGHGACISCHWSFSTPEVSIQDKLKYLRASLTPIQLKYIVDILLDRAEDCGWSGCSRTDLQDTAKMFLGEEIRWWKRDSRGG